MGIDIVRKLPRGSDELRAEGWIIINQVKKKKKHFKKEN